MRHLSGSAPTWLGHPATVIATFVLLTNDHLLKHLWPGLVTGKLGDLTGLIAVTAAAPESYPPPELNLGAERVTGIFAGLLTFLAGTAAACRHRKSTVVFAAIASAFVSAGFLITLQGAGRPYLIVNLPFVLGGACALLGMIFAIVTAVAARPRGWTWLFLLVTPPATMLTVWSLFSGWLRGTPEYYSTAVWLSCLAVIIGVATTVTAGHRGRRPIVREDSRLEIVTGEDSEDPA
ncbi:hypothetical protein ACFFMN_16140 [Planobispora siamensis]|uniref:DUF998 domain-containing protein n=1 Tax=Planobispora siamensis TaxID=936338 RepID=A0A8J3SKA5_9ACTN|nr:hypothetical protein [Planobispora siamensis]GIH93849.1 hypothetical protein Psi01_44790 [Planobispora siamensis]